jgi:hypothetical protein
MSDINSDLRSLRDLVSSGLHQASGLVSNEIALARAEISEKLAQAGRGAAMIFVGALILVPALTLLLLAIAAAVMALGMSAAASYLVTGAGAAIVAAIVIMIGIGRLSGDNLTPTTTIDQMRRDGEAVREMVR